ncbi:hypothetical protein GSY74_00930, partial [Sulfurovum sp. bin170]|uniref:hypothetical protein n=1 Tax=Sulfurovum sp. bin170 TaxID=2695268 RepID=UPI0013DF68D4
MTIHLLVGIISSVLLLTSFAITKRNREEAYALRASRKEEAHIEEELMIHTALEQAGALPKHHGQHHGDSHNKAKSHSINIRLLFNSIGYAVIAIELLY